MIVIYLGNKNNGLFLRDMIDPKSCDDANLRSCDRLSKYGSLPQDLGVRSREKERIWQLGRNLSKIRV